MKDNNKNMVELLEEMSYAASEHLTSNIMDSINSESAHGNSGKGQEIIQIWYRALTISAAACILIMIGYTYIYEGAINMDSLLGIGSDLNADLFEIIEETNYEN